MTDDAMKRAWDAWHRTQDRPLSRAVTPLAQGFFEVGWNARDAHHYAEVHELRSLLKDTYQYLELCNFSNGGCEEDVGNLLNRIDALLAKGDNNVG